ncbi:MAG: 16S rRNA (guanine(527)-N(7))-methyltransferase RsmG [Desulfobacteraceae bacterium]|nr:16S rRNA (guanine(527)-N(7))-methyltransferase RsmG [Desulfobacteraceae bacterium]
MKKKKSPDTANGGPPGPQDMDGVLCGCGIELSSKQLSLLWQYHNLLRRYNPELNLTRIHRFENMVLKLYADSILPMRFVDLPSPLLDIGTGAGMPGIPLKIACPDIEIVLAESRANRAEFLKTVLEKLGLSGISVYGHAITSGYEQSAAGIITRAVENMEKTLERIQGCLEHDGLAVFMKGPHCDHEILEATKKFQNRFRLTEDIAYQIPGTSHHRRLVIFQRKDAPLRRQKEKAMKKHRVRIIESEQNRTFRELKKLLTAKGAKKQQQALISGTKQVREILSAFGPQCLAWISKSDNQPPPANLPAHAAWYQIEPRLFDTLDIIGTNSPLLLVKTPEVPAWDPQQGLPYGCNVLVPFQDPENVGTVIRSAAAFGANTVIMLSEAAYPFHPRAVRASGGAVMHARIMQGPSILKLPEDLPIVALSVEGTPVGKFDFPETFGILPGMEGPGIPKYLQRTTVSVPISPQIESLNASAATAVALYVWSQTKTSRQD